MHEVRHPDGRDFDKTLANMADVIKMNGVGPLKGQDEFKIAAMLREGVTLETGTSFVGTNPGAVLSEWERWRDNQPED